MQICTVPTVLTARRRLAAALNVEAADGLSTANTVPDERFDASSLGYRNAKKKVSNPLPGVARRERPTADLRGRRSERRLRAQSRSVKSQQHTHAAQNFLQLLSVRCRHAA